MRPFVLIGTGGSGGKLLRVVREVLRQRLQAVGYEGEWPKSWQLLHIDVPAQADGVTKDLPFKLGREEYFPLTVVTSEYETFDGQVAHVRGEPRQRYVAYDSWRPFPPHDVHVEIANGAGQYRAVGRVALLANLSRARTRIATSLNEAKSAPLDVLADIEQLLTGNAGDVTETQPLVIVAGSLAGGSGSGTVLDICDILRSLGEQNALALLFTPELFTQQSGAVSGLAPNTFMAINELSNAMWVAADEDSPRTRRSLFAMGGVADRPGRGGPVSAILIGSRNGNVSLGASTEIYKVMGRALGEMLLDSTLIGEFTAVTFGNPAALALGSVNHYPVRIPGSASFPHYRGLGFARLSIGRDLLRRYSAERLARASCERLLDYHLWNRQPGDPASDEDMVNRVATLMEAEFVQRCGLDELGGDANQVIDAIEPPEGRGLLSDMAARQLQEALDHMDGKRMHADEVRGVIAVAAEAQLSPGGSTVRGRFDAALYACAKEWTRTVQDRLSETIPWAMSSVGLPVTRELIERTIARSTAAADELHRDAGRYERASADRLAQLRTPQAGGKARFAPEAEDLKASVALARDAVGNSCYARQLSLAEALLRDLAENLLKPWRTAVTDAEALLRLEVRPPNGAPAEVDFWPTSSGVPDQYRPSKIEFLLDDPDAFPTMFEQMILQSVEEQSTPLAAQETAVRDILEGEEEPSVIGGTRPVVSRRKDWTPTTAAVRSRMDLPAPAVLELHLTVDDLLDRANRWLRVDIRYSGRFLRQSLAEYLEDREVHAGIRSQRRTALVGQFLAMLRASAPLVSVNQELLQKVHNRAHQDVQLVMTPLNIPDDPELLNALNGAAVEAGLAPGSVKVTNQRSQGCQVFQIHNDVAEQAVFDSLMEPLANRWAQVEEDPETRADFWRFRRTRPLSEWVPVDPPTRRAIVRGWIIARLLGHARFTRDTLERLRFEVYGQTTGGPGWMVLPAYGPRPLTKGFATAHLLELLPVGMIDAYRAKDLGPLYPWRALIALADGAKISQWIEHGTGAMPDALLGATSASDPATRSQELLRLLDRRESEGKSDCVIPEIPNVLQLQANPMIEIYDDYLEALSEIRRVAVSVQTSSDRAD